MEPTIRNELVRARMAELRAEAEAYRLARGTTRRSRRSGWADMVRSLTRSVGRGSIRAAAPRSTSAPSR